MNFQTVTPTLNIFISLTLSHLGDLIHSQPGGGGGGIRPPPYLCFPWSKSNQICCSDSPS